MDKCCDRESACVAEKRAAVSNRYKTLTRFSLHSSVVHLLRPLCIPSDQKR